MTWPARILLAWFIFWVGALSGVFLCQGYSHANPYHVVVDEQVDDNYSIQTRIMRQISDGDEIAVIVLPETKIDLLGENLNNAYPDEILLLAIGDDVWVRGNDWVSQTAIANMLDRIDNVTRQPIDQIIKLITEVHRYQNKTPSPTPPPPPAPEGGVQPREPIDVSGFHMPTWAWWTGGSVGVLFVIWLPLELRRRRRYGDIARRAQEQLDWPLEKYGIKTSLD